MPRLDDGDHGLVGQIEPATLLFIAGVLLFTFTLFRRMRIRARTPVATIHTTPVPSKPTSTKSTITSAAAATTRITDDFEVRTHNLIREWTARLDTRINLLNELIVDADRRVEELKRWSRTERSSLMPEDPVVVGIDAGPEKPGKFDEIYALADRNMTPAEISQRMNLPLGEVQLLLGLRRRRKSG